MVLTAVAAAVLCVLGPLSIPIGIVPISFTNFALFISLYALGMKNGTYGYIIYLLIGLTGVPVFSNFSGGIGKLLGPTGGYLIGMIFTAVIAGLFIDRFLNKKILCFLGMVIGALVCYLFGSAWLSYQGHMSIAQSLSVGVIPFIPGDLAKILIVALIGPKIRKRLTESRVDS
jgi:biotin transport system substrate-specific component